MNMKMGRLYMVGGNPIISEEVKDSIWAVEESNGFRVYAAPGDCDEATLCRFVKTPCAADALAVAQNPFGDLSTNGWEAV